jgi:hypothetical protein
VHLLLLFYDPINLGSSIRYSSDMSKIPGKVSKKDQGSQQLNKSLQNAPDVCRDLS